MPNSTGSQQSDRLELARRLHDGPAQRLVALGFQLDALIGDSELSQAHRTSIRNIRLEISELSQSFRDEIYLLRLVTFAEVATLLTEFLDSFEVQVDLPKNTFSPEIESRLAQVFLEIARNTKRHSGANFFSIGHKAGENSITFNLFDNGTWKIAPSNSSFGLKLIAEEIAKLNGAITWSTGSEGSKLQIEMPL